MVDVRMSEQHEIQFRIRDRQRLVHKQVFPLLHAEVDDSLSLSHGNQRAGACDLMRCAVKSNLHPLWSPSVHDRDLNHSF